MAEKIKRKFVDLIPFGKRILSESSSQSKKLAPKIATTSNELER